MEPLREDQLIAELRALRPTPRPAFAAQLDERAAAGFPRRSRLGGFAPSGSPLASLAQRMRALPRRRLLLPAGGLALVAIAVTTAVVVSTEGEETHSGLLSQMSGETSPEPRAAPQYFEGSARVQKSAAGAEAELEAGALADSAAPTAGNLSLKPRHRDVERSAAIVLVAKPEDVADDAAKVFATVHAHEGIVLRSGTQEGAAGDARASFEMLIPSRRLGDALAALSAIDEVRSRHEATADITAPTVSASELLKESRARIDSLLAQLEGAETESEREAVEAELRHERRHASRLASRLEGLHRRANFSRVTLQIETGEASASGGGAWGIDEALGDAGKILTVVAAVALVGLAVIGPIALIALLAWLAHRAWVRRERRRVLG